VGNFDEQHWGFSRFWHTFGDAGVARVACGIGLIGVIMIGM